MKEQEILKIIESFDWKFAKTMPKNPHFYTVKQKQDRKKSEDYEKLYNYIRENHYIEYFKGYPYKCCHIGEWTYWAMTDDINESVVINRKRRGE